MEEGELSSSGEGDHHIEQSQSIGKTPPMTPMRGNLLARKRWTGCLRLDEFKMEEKVGEGTFGVVHKAVNRRTGKVVALKRILVRPEQEGFPITALREIKLLKLVKHPNVMSISEVAVAPDDPTGGVYMIFPFMDHDLTGLLELPGVKFSIPQIKLYMKQLLHGIAYLHDVQILHRDVKGANLLLNNNGELCVTDFGLARAVEENRVHYTPGVVTRWYRPPELLLGATQYGYAVDMWGVGCILGEMLMKKPLLPGESDFHQLELVAKLCGTPTEETMPGCSQLPDWTKVRLPVCRRQILEVFGQYDRLAADLIDRLLQLDPAKRLTARQALKHDFFTSAPAAALPSDLPRYPSKHELDAMGRGDGVELHDAPHPTPHRHGRESNEYERRPQRRANGHGDSSRGPPPPPPPLRGRDTPGESKSSAEPPSSANVASATKPGSKYLGEKTRDRSKPRLPETPRDSESERERADREREAQRYRADRERMRERDRDSGRDSGRDFGRDRAYPRERPYRSPPREHSSQHSSRDHLPISHLHIRPHHPQYEEPVHIRHHHQYEEPVRMPYTHPAERYYHDRPTHPHHDQAERRQVYPHPDEMRGGKRPIQQYAPQYTDEYASGDVDIYELDEPELKRREVVQPAATGKIPIYHSRPQI